jgi:hypothetical protein
MTTRADRESRKRLKLLREARQHLMLTQEARGAIVNS